MPGTANARSFVSFSSLSALLFRGNKSRGGAGIQGWFLQEEAQGAGTQMPPHFCCSLMPSAAALGAPRLSQPKAWLLLHPLRSLPQHWITQLEIMLLPVPSKPSGASAKVNTSSSQFH